MFFLVGPKTVLSVWVRCFVPKLSQTDLRVLSVYFVHSQSAYILSGPNLCPTKSRLFKQSSLSGFVTQTSLARTPCDRHADNLMVASCGTRNSLPQFTAEGGQGSRPAYQV